MIDQPLQDFMMALLIVSTVVFALTPVFFGFTRQQKHASVFSWEFCLIDFPLILSFAVGCAVILLITIWYNERLSSAASGYEPFVRGTFLAQMASFMFGVFIYLGSSLNLKRDCRR